MRFARAQAMTLEELRRQGLEDWTVRPCRALGYAGITYGSRREIHLSVPHLDAMDENEVRNTVLHEVAHALAGDAEGHGPRWRKIALALGSDGEEVYDLREEVAEQVLASSRYHATCEHCGATHYRARRTRSMGNLACAETPQCSTLRWIDRKATRPGE